MLANKYIALNNYSYLILSQNAQRLTEADYYHASRHNFLSYCWLCKYWLFDAIVVII